MRVAYKLLTFHLAMTLACSSVSVTIHGLSCRSAVQCESVVPSESFVYNAQGMSEDVSINKFFDDPMLLELAKQDAEMQPIY